MQIEDVPVRRIRESPHNARKHFDPKKMEELTQSIRTRGVDSPILLRPVPVDEAGTDLEVVYGHRRKRASIAAGLLAIPATIRAMSDKDAVDAALTENAQREDIHPLEEGDAFKHAIDAFGETVQEIAGRIGKSPSYIYQRLLMARLCEPARQAFWKGKLTPATALIVARIPNEKLQATAAKEIAEPRFGHDGEALSARAAAEYVRRTFMLRLVGAPFDRADAMLVQKAGPCTTCPKRTGAQPELFADVGSKDDLCIDPGCFESKRDAAWQLRVEQAKANKQPVIPAKDSKKLFPFSSGLAHDAPYVDLATKCYDDPKNRTYGQLLGRKTDIVKTLARDPDGGVHELVPKAGLKAALKKAGHDFKRPTNLADSKGQSSSDGKRKAERENREKAAGSAVLLIVDTIEKAGGTLLQTHWQLFVQLLMDELCPEDVLKRRQVGKKPEDVDAYIGACTVPQLQALAFELTIGCCADRVWTSYPKSFTRACQVLGVDLAGLEKAAAEEAAALERGKATKAQAAKEKAAKPNGEPVKKKGKAPAKKPARAAALDLPGASA